MSGTTAIEPRAPSDLSRSIPPVADAGGSGVVSALAGSEKPTAPKEMAAIPARVLCNSFTPPKLAAYYYPQLTNR